MRQWFDGGNDGLVGLNRDAQPQDVLIVVNEFYFQVAIGMATAQQDIALVTLELRQREGGVFLHLQVAVQQKRLAGSALSLSTSMRQRHPLTKGRVENCLVFVDLNLNSDRLKTNFVSSHS